MSTSGLHFVLAKENADAADWWLELDKEQRKLYLEQHPNSKYADLVDRQLEKEEKETKTEDITADELDAGSPQRRAVSSSISKSAPKISRILKKTFPKISIATSALKHLAQGKALDNEHKEVLHELGHLTLKTALSHAVGVDAAKLIAHVGVTAVSHAIQHFSPKPGQDEVEAFVHSVAEGVTDAKAASVPEDHTSPGSDYRSAIGSTVKKSAKHIVSVIEKSFGDIKPATKGLQSIAKGKTPEPHEKQALKRFGKIALASTIATLPGGIAAHIVAGVGASALTYAFKKCKGYHDSSEHGISIVHHFVESLGEGIEDALLEKAAGE